MYVKNLICRGGAQGPKYDCQNISLQGKGWKTSQSSHGYALLYAFGYCAQHVIFATIVPPNRLPLTISSAIIGGMSTKRLTTYELNTVTWLEALTQQYGETITLATVPAEEWDRVSGYGCNAVWLMGVWERSPAALAINKADPEFMRYIKGLLPSFDFDRDMVGSAYSIRAYTVSADLGGPAALAIARAELKKRGLVLILDYVPNHVALDHPWAVKHPEYFVQGSPEDLKREPDAYAQVGTNVLARGRDPGFDPWSDVLQLNSFSKELRQATADTIASIAAQCDGVRCDMAMLFTGQVFMYTWQDRAGQPLNEEFWAEVIGAVRTKHPGFLFIAEAYWHAEQQLFELGFDYCYDKETFYDSVKEGVTSELLYLLLKPVEHQRRMVRFLENHDEPRAAHTFPLGKHKAAAVLLATTPGSCMYYEGQFDGLQLRTPVHVRRDPPGKPDSRIQAFYSQLLPLTRSIQNDFATWCMCRIVTIGQHPIDNVMAWTWQGADDVHYLVVVNWSGRKRHARVMLPWNAGASAKATCLLSTRDVAAELRCADQSLDCQLAPFQAVILEIATVA